MSCDLSKDFLEACDNAFAILSQVDEDTNERLDMIRIIGLKKLSSLKFCYDRIRKPNDIKTSADLLLSFNDFVNELDKMAYSSFNISSLRGDELSSLNESAESLKQVVKKARLLFS